MSRTYAAIPPPPYLYGEPANLKEEASLKYDPFSRIQYWEALQQKQHETLQHKQYSGGGDSVGRLGTKLRPSSRMGSAEAYPQPAATTASNAYLGGGLGYSGSSAGGVSGGGRVVFVGGTK